MKLMRTMFIGCLMVAISLVGSECRSIELHFKDPTWSFQALRTVSATAGGGADIGECLKTIYRVKEGDVESWYEEWLKAAVQREKTGDEFASKDHVKSAGQEYLRASSYYRTAEFFLHVNPKDPRILDTWRMSRECFLKYTKRADHPIIQVDIPFEGVKLPGYLCLVDESGAKRPLIIMHSGFDGTAEELYYNRAVFAVKRGYNCLLFEGPGQGGVIRELNLPFRPNWETVVTPVVDFALNRKEVDPERIALMGISLGGYLAPRAVAFEHRVRACIANGGVYDFHAAFVKPDLEKGLDDPAGRQEIDKEVHNRMKTNSTERWVFGHAMLTFHTESPSEWMRMTRPYTMKDVASKIKCPVLVVDSEGDRYLRGQAKKLFEALQCPKDFILFTNEEGGGEHCQFGALRLSNERVLNWLDDVMK
ncbi:alpha/beta hydrolase family protein [Thermodesulfobacteriota bacterium]